MLCRVPFVVENAMYVGDFTIRLSFIFPPKAFLIFFSSFSLPDQFKLLVWLLCYFVFLIKLFMVLFNFNWKLVKESWFRFSWSGLTCRALDIFLESLMTSRRIKVQADAEIWAWTLLSEFK